MKKDLPAWASLLDAAMSRRRAVAGVSAAAVAPALFSAAHAQDATPAPEPIPGGTLRVGVQGDPVELDPALVVLDAASLIIDQVYEGLMHEDPSLVPQPRLAESYEISEDGLTYTFTLREGVRFHNGREMTSEDVVYSIGRVMDDETASPWQQYTATIEAMETPDPSTVVFRMKNPDASFLASLCRRGLSVVPQEEVEENGDLRLVMVGTGPFRFVDYVPNSMVTLEKNDDYWLEGRPYLDGLEFQVIPDDTARTTALVSNTVDMIEAVPHKDLATLREASEITLTGDQATNLRWIVFNVRHEPLNNRELRRMIASGIQRQAVIDTAVFGYGTPLYGVYPSDYWAGYEGEVPEGDPEAAARAISQLSLPSGFRPGILTWGEYDFLSSTSIVVQEQLNTMGITAEIEPEENATYLERYFSGDFDIAVMGAGGYIDPHDFLGQTMGTDGVANAAGYSSAKMDELLLAGIVEQDREARKAIYQEIQDLIIEDVPWIMLYTSNTYEGMSANVMGFTHSLSGSFTALRETWIQP
jgi:peptide/nickel transport system substrate-binding protein